MMGSFGSDNVTLNFDLEHKIIKVKTDEYTWVIDTENGQSEYQASQMDFQTGLKIDSKSEKNESKSDEIPENKKEERDIEFKVILAFQLMYYLVLVLVLSVSVYFSLKK